jgi:exoribonuclease R
MNQPLVGILEFTSKYRYGLTSRGAPLYLFRPYDTAQPEYIVGSSQRDLSRNQIALVDCPHQEQATGIQKPRGSLVRLFGPVGDPIAEKAALLQHYCPQKQSSTMTHEAAGQEEDRQPLDADHGWITFHIDPPGCRDIDDAISYHHDTKTWAITIADVAAAVLPDSPMDTVAKAIGSTFYNLEGQVVRPMLPPSISEDAASLLPDTQRRGLTLFLEPNKKERFGLTWITVAHSFTYDSFAGSAVAYDLQISREPHAWIEELMIRYNCAAAKQLKAAACGILRVQPVADAAAVAHWSTVSPELAFLANEAAVYQNACEDVLQVHATLGTEYCHASSPLRRYADLVNQRVLKALLKGTAPPSVSPTEVQQLNQRLKATRRWTRDLTFLTHVTPGRIHTLDVIWLSPTSGEEKHQVWVPLWKRVLRIRHDEGPKEPGSTGRIQIFCDPTKRNWRERVLTAQG